MSSAGKVAKNTAYLLTAFVGQKLLAFVYFTIIARSVGVQGSGRYFLATSFTTIFAIFIDLGLSNVLIREVAKFPDKAQKILANVLGAKVVLAVATVAATIGAARLLNYSAEVQMMITIACVVMVLDSVHLVLYAVMRGLQNLKYESVGVVVGQFVTIVSGAIFLALKFPLPWLIVALLIGSTWNVIWSVSVLWRKFGIRSRLEWDRSMLAFIVAITLPFALSGIFSRVYSSIDSIMLSKLSTEAAVGYYGVAYKIVFAFQFLPIAFSAAVYPAMSTYYVSNRERLRVIFTTAMTYLTIVVVPITFGIFILSREIVLTLYGHDFAGSIPILRAMIFSLIPGFLYWPGGSLLNASDRQKDNTVALGWTTGSNVILNAILIPTVGAIGAAFADLFSNTLLFIIALVYALRVTRLETRAYLRSLGKATLSGMVMVGCVLLLRGRVNLGVVILAGGVVYTAMLFATKCVTKTELKFIAETFLKRRKAATVVVPESP